MNQITSDSLIKRLTDGEDFVENKQLKEVRLTVRVRLG